MIAQNNNREIINKIIRRLIKKNKARNILTIFAVILTTFMIFSVFSIGLSLAENSRTMVLRMKGSATDVTLNEPSAEQIETLKASEYFDSVGIYVSVGRVFSENINSDNVSINLEYYDNEGFEKQIVPCISNIQGSYPTKEDEIMISRLSLELLGLSNSNIGESINLLTLINGIEENRKFKISGIYTDYEAVPDTEHILVSEELVNNLNISKDAETLLLKLNLKYKSDRQNLLQRSFQLKNNQEFSFLDDVRYESIDKVVTAVFAIIIVVSFLAFSGYLLIYNVFYINITKNINFYGLLKTIGTSPRQIRRIVNHQVIFLGIIGITIGLIFGTVTSFFILPGFMKTIGDGNYYFVMPKNIYFNPFVFIGTITFTFLVVLISMHKPAKIASTISPVESLRYTGVSYKCWNKKRYTTNGGKVYKIAFFNVFRDKKRSVIVFISLFMGITTFLLIHTTLDSLNINNYFQKYLREDFVIENMDFSKNKISDEMVDEIKSMQGIDKVKKANISRIEIDLNQKFFSELFTQTYMSKQMSEEQRTNIFQDLAEKNEEYKFYVIGIDNAYIEEYNENSEEKINVEAFKKGEIALVKPDIYGLKQKIKIDNLNMREFFVTDLVNKRTKEFKAKFVDDKQEILPRRMSSIIGAPSIYISLDSMNALNEYADNYIIGVNVNKIYEPDIEKKLKVLVQSNGLDFFSKSDTLENFNDNIRVMNIIGSSISITLIIVGILNFINVMITGIITRLKELAVMESIGMTKKQVNKMLMMEGIYYAAITMFLVFTLGMLIIYGASLLIVKIADYAVFKFPSILLFVITVFVFIICTVIPLIVYKVNCKETITERIRSLE